MFDINIIVAAANNNAIGDNNKLLTLIKGDLPRFKELTMNNTIIMGRKTYESLPNGALPNRRNIILTRNYDYNAQNCEIYNSVDDILSNIRQHEKVFIIGGSEIYDLFIQYSHTIYLTKINLNFPSADTFLSNKFISELMQHFNIIETTINDKNDFDCKYITYKRVS